MRVVAFDTETALFRPGTMAPELSCITWQSPGLDARIAHWSDSRPRLKSWLEDPETMLVGHNVAYDLAVVAAQFPDLRPLIFAALDADRVTDTMIRQQLLDIAAGCFRGKLGDGNVWITYKYSLLDVARRLSGRVLDKDEWRLGYGPLRDVPLAEWPEGARTYPLDDARATLECYLAQEVHKEFLAPQFHETRSAFWLHLCSAWGLRTDEGRVKTLEAETTQKRDEVQAGLVGWSRASGWQP